MKHHNRRFLAVFLVAMAACLDVSFSVDKVAEMTVDGHSKTTSSVVVVDLSTNSDFQDHKGKVNGISLEKLTMWISTVNPGNQSTQVLSADISLRADGAPADGSADVKIATVATTLSFQTYLETGGGQKLTVGLTDQQARAANQFLMDKVVRGSGKFTAVVSAAVDQNETHVNLKLDFTSSLSYGLL